MKRRNSSNRAAFTLLEIMLVVAIIALLLSTGFYFLGPQIEIARDAKLGADFKSLDQALHTYENLNGFLPTTEQGLQALVTAPSSDPKPQRWYQMMERLPQDPYKEDYIYVCPGTHNPQGYDIYSKGKDRVANTADDKGNWDFK